MGASGGFDSSGESSGESSGSSSESSGTSDDEEPGTGVAGFFGGLLGGRLGGSSAGPRPRSGRNGKAPRKQLAAKAARRAPRPSEGKPSWQIEREEREARETNYLLRRQRLVEEAERKTWHELQDISSKREAREAREALTAQFLRAEEHQGLLREAAERACEVQAEAASQAKAHKRAQLKEAKRIMRRLRSRLPATAWGAQTCAVPELSPELEPPQVLRVLCAHFQTQDEKNRSGVLLLSADEAADRIAQEMTRPLTGKVLLGMTQKKLEAVLGALIGGMSEDDKPPQFNRWRDAGGEAKNKANQAAGRQPWEDWPREEWPPELRAKEDAWNAWSAKASVRISVAWAIKKEVKEVNAEARKQRRLQAARAKSAAASADTPQLAEHVLGIEEVRDQIFSHILTLREFCVLRRVSKGWQGLVHSCLTPRIKMLMQDYDFEKEADAIRKLDKPSQAAAKDAMEASILRRFGPLVPVVGLESGCRSLVYISDERFHFKGFGRAKKRTDEKKIYQLGMGNVSQLDKALRRCSQKPFCKLQSVMMIGAVAARASAAQPGSFFSKEALCDVSGMAPSSSASMWKKVSRDVLSAFHPFHGPSELVVDRPGRSASSSTARARRPTTGVGRWGVCGRTGSGNESNQGAATWMSA